MLTDGFNAKTVAFVSKRTAWGIAIVVALACIIASISDMKAPFDFHRRQKDLEVYYTAANIIQTHRHEEIYDGADNGRDPQLVVAEKDSIFAKEALSHGIAEIQLYVYPPTLAYAMVPLSSFSIAQAASIWKIFNWMAIVLIAAMLANIMGMRLLGFGSFGLVLFLFVYRPFLDCFHWGQITILLTLLDVGGMFLLIRGHKALGTLLFAIATAIKLTPVIVIVPLIAWRDWKALGAFGLWGAGILGMLWLPDHGRLLQHYCEHVLPSMSSGIITFGNKSLSSALQLLWLAIAHGSSARWPVILAKAFSALAGIYAGWLCRSKPRVEDRDYQARVFSLIWLLSCCVAPVSWRHAYVLSAPALVLLFQQMLAGKGRLTETILLCCFTLSIASFGFADIAKSTGSFLLTVWATSTPVLGVALVILELRNTRRINRSGDENMRTGSRASHVADFAQVPVLGGGVLRLV